jgi:prepilin-type N-terminal cleavage/methylation domain-containing protein
MRDRESGFTLIEVMAAVAVVSILAAIAIPSFFGETRKARAAAEVAPMFNDLRIRLEQYLQENGVYPDTLGETTLYPTANPTSTPLPLQTPLQPLPATWRAIKVTPSGPDEVRCGYTWVTSRSGNGAIGPTAANAGPEAAVFAFVPPDRDWYYLLAKCKFDNTHTTYSWYFTSSLDATIKKDNEGQ